MSLRRYPHPGKFEGGLVIDELAYAATMDGCDGELGDVSEHGEWYGLVYGPIDPHEACGIDLTDDERAYLLSTAGCIVSEDSQGFVGVDWYDTKDKLEAVWLGMCEEFEANCEDSDCEDSSPIPEGWDSV